MIDPKKPEEHVENVMFWSVFVMAWFLVGKWAIETVAQKARWKRLRKY